MEDNSWFTRHQWCDEHHKEFYEKLKHLSPEEQSKAILSQASILTLHGDEHEGNYQAAESLIHYWTENLADPQQIEIAQEIINDLQKRINS